MGERLEQERLDQKRRQEDHVAEREEAKKKLIIQVPTPVDF
jgi:hypothetical protein